MDILGYCFFSAIALTLIFAGISKIISYSNTIETIKKIGIFPKKFSRVVGICMPIFEIIIGIFLIIRPHIIILLLMIAYLLFFIGLNLKYTMEKKEIKCCCYGKVIQSKLGKSGLIHYLYLLFLLIIGYLCINKPIISVLNSDQIGKVEILVSICSVSILMINGFIIRSVIEKYTLKEW